MVKEQDTDFVPAHPWVSLREPSPLVLNLLSLPIAILMAFAMWYAWQDPAVLYGLTTYGFLLTIPFLIFAHELVHAFACPHFGLTKQTTVGLWPSRLMFYAHHDGEIKRGRFLVFAFMPLIVLTLLPIAIARVTGFTHWWLGSVSFMNGIFACGDILVALIILSQVPSNAVVRNKGYKTYWKSV